MYISMQRMQSSGCQQNLTKFSKIVQGEAGNAAAWRNSLENFKVSTLSKPEKNFFLYEYLQLRLRVR